MFGRLGDGVGVGRCFCFECLKVEGLRVESSETTLTYDNDDDNDTKSNTARAATFTPGHVDRQKSSSGGSPNKEAGTTPSGVSVPSQGVSSLDESANSVLPGRNLKLWLSPCERMGGTQIHFVNVSPGGSTRAANHSVANLLILPLFTRRKGQGPKAKPAG